jgi:cytochrome c oxidase subunit 2
MECRAVPLAALSTEHKVGLAVAAAIFIVFSLLSALVIPRYKPDFPGKARGAFLAACVLLLVGMMAAVLVFGQEEEEAEAHETPTEETTGTTETTATTGTTTAPVGDAAAGRQVFVASGCGSCHTFTPAGSSGQVGPNLSEALQGKDVAFIEESIEDPNAEVTQGYQPNVMPQTYGQQLSDKQLDDLVAFLQS